MKKIILVIALLATTVAVNAQQGLRFGLAGAYNSTWLFNKNVSDAGDNLDYKSSFGGQFGISALFNFEENIGVSADLFFLSSVNQKYTNRYAGVTYETETSLKYITLPLLFRYTSVKGPYFEIGPEFSFGGTGKVSTPATETTIDSKYLNSSNIAAVLGFGVDIKASEQISITAGLRFAWGLADVFKKQPDGLDLMVPSKPYEATNTAVGGLHLGVNYRLAKK